MLPAAAGAGRGAPRDRRRPGPRAPCWRSRSSGPGHWRPTPSATARVSAACHAAGLVTLTCGTYGNVLRFLPPLVTPDHLILEGLDILEQAIAA